MIHPINLPEELLAVNPTKPSLMEVRRKPRISYMSDGRKLKDGQPLSPRTPTTLWENVFVRSFIRRMAYDAKAEAEETASTGSVIDIVDLHSADSTGSILPKNTSSGDLVPDRPSLNSSDNEEEASAAPRILRRSSGQFSKTDSSILVANDSLRPIMTDCCSSTPKGFREFLRFDFSRSQSIMPGATETVPVVHDHHHHEHHQRKTSVSLIPHNLSELAHAFGSRKKLVSQLAAQFTWQNPADLCYAST